jgi:hypothetical protein
MNKKINHIKKDLKNLLTVILVLLVILIVLNILNLKFNFLEKIVQNFLIKK